MSLCNALCLILLQMMWLCHQMFERGSPKGSLQDQSSTPKQPLKRLRATRFCAREFEGCIVMAPVEEDMLRYSYTEIPKVQQYGVLPTEYIPRDVFTNMWLESFT